MTTTDEDTTEKSADAGGETMADMILRAVESFDGTALRYRDGEEWKEVSYADLGERVRNLAKGLIALGLDKGDAVAIFADTRPEWVEADLAAALAGLVVACVYQTSSPDEAHHVLENSDAKLCFVESEELLERVQEVQGSLEHLEHIVIFEGDAPDDGMTLDELAERGEGEDDDGLDGRVDEISSDDLFTLVYTSGTTGPPKGCMLTHGNLRAGLDAFPASFEIDEDSVFYAFLPLAHVLTRAAELVAIDNGSTIAFWQQDKDKIIDDLADVAPTHFAAVPRIFEKIYNKATAQADGGLREKALEKAVEVGRKVRELERAGEKPGPVLRAEHELADRQILSKVRDLFGGRLEIAMTGAAPVAKEMLEFFDAAGVLVLEGWGLSETSALATVNAPDDFRFGTQGKPVEGCEVHVGEPAEDESGEEGEADPGGEIFVRGPNVFTGYYKMQEETDEDLDEDGWFSTGDVGTFDDDGFLTISGRTKDIVITSSGKNIAAANIENEITDHRWISQAVVYGDDKNYLVAIVTIDDDERSALADQAGSGEDPEEMAQSDAVREELWKAIEEANQKFASIEQVKKFDVLERDLSQDEGELTPTMKVKRQAVYENHRDRFEALYEGDE